MKFTIKSESIIVAINLSINQSIEKTFENLVLLQIQSGIISDSLKAHNDNNEGLSTNVYVATEFRVTIDKSLFWQSQYLHSASSFNERSLPSVAVQKLISHAQITDNACAINNKLTLITTSKYVSLCGSKRLSEKNYWHLPY